MSSPHQTYSHQDSTAALPTLMRGVIFACLPGILVQFYFWGYGPLIQIILCVTTAIIAETCVLQLRQRPVLRTLTDHSALLTGVLLGIALPPYAPWWIAVIGSSAAIVIAKHFYGGLGQNLFNPAMVGYVVVLIAFPLPMSHWMNGQPGFFHHLDALQSLSLIFTQSVQDSIFVLQQINADGLTQATPLDTWHNQRRQQLPLHTETSAMFSWYSLNIAFVIGGLLLIWRNIISWIIPVTFIVTLSLCTGITWLIDAQSYPQPLMLLFSGATMFCAFFIATDPVTSATTRLGQGIYAGLIALFTWIIRYWGGYPDGIAFAILLANLTVPLLDHYTQPRVYGYKS